MLSCTHFYYFFPVSIHSCKGIHCLLQLYVIEKYYVRCYVKLKCTNVMIPYKRDFETMNKSVINYLPRCSYHLLYKKQLLGLLSSINQKINCNKLVDLYKTLNWNRIKSLPSFNLKLLYFKNRGQSNEKFTTQGI